MQEKIKVIHVIADLGNGGAERQLIELLKCNPSHNLLIFKNSGIYQKELDRYKIKYTELNIQSSIGIILKLLRVKEIILASGSTIIHAWMYNACIISILFIMPFIQDCWTNQWLADNLPPSLNSLYKINLYPKYDDSYLDPTLNPINESLDSILKGKLRS